MPWLDTAQDLYVNGSMSSIFEASNLVYSSAGLPSGTWFGLFNFTIIVVVMIWSKSNAITGTYGLLTSSLFVFLEAMGVLILPGWVLTMEYIIIVLCLAMVMYEVFGPRDR